MRFGDAWLLVALVAVPALVAFFVLAERRRRVLLDRFLSSQLASRLTPSVSPTRRRVKEVLLVLGLTFALLAAARPQWGYRWEQIARRGIEIVLVVDTSQSMLAQDASPNRLERAKLELAELIEALEGDQVGVVAFAGTAFVQCPMTPDRRAAELFLRQIDTRLIPIPGTAIGTAVRVATGLFRGRGHDSKAMILITDGEDQGSEPLQAAELAAEAGVRIFAVGIGGDSPALIPVDEQGTLKKDADGKLVQTQLDEDTLREMARITDGAYVRSVVAELKVPELIAEVRAKTTPREVRGERVQRWEDRYQGLALLAFLLLLVEPLVDERRARGPGGRFRDAIAPWLSRALRRSTDDDLVAGRPPAPRTGPAAGAGARDHAARDHAAGGG